MGETTAARTRSCLKFHPVPVPGECGVCRAYATHPAYGGPGAPASSAQDEAAPAGPPAPAALEGGPGSRLKGLIASLGFEPCGPCGDLSDQMDRWGVEGCQRRRETILLWLRGQQAKRGWLEKARAGVLAVSSGLALKLKLNPLDPAPGLLDEALRLAREDDARAASEPWRWVSTADLVNVTLGKLLPKLPPDVSGVCGVSRSGMLPAAALSASLHLPLWYVSQHDGSPVRMPGGSRGVASRPGRLLVVDDTVYSGRVIAKLRRRFKAERHLYAAVFVRPAAASVCDLAGEELPSPHLLEWNLANSGPFLGNAINPRMRGGVALDFDGVVCVDPTAREADDPAGYAAWLAEARPLMLPRRAPVPLVVTARLERHREATLAWCARWGVRVGKMEMWPGGDPRARDRADVAAWKAGRYAASGCSLYVESDPGLARRVARLSGRPVACPAAGRVYR